jgi:hypothetical protein
LRCGTICAESICVSGTNTGALKISPTRFATLGKFAAAPVARIRVGRGVWSYGSNDNPRLDSESADRPDELEPPWSSEEDEDEDDGGGGVELTLALERMEPRTPVEMSRDHLTRKERTWLSTRQRGLARRSRNSLTLMPVSKR